VLPTDIPQLHLDEGNLLPIGRMSVANRHTLDGDSIHWGSLAQWWFRLYKLRSLSANLLGYTKLPNPTTCFHNKKSPVLQLHGCYLQSTMRDPLKSRQDLHLSSPLIIHSNGTVHGVAWDWH